MVSALLVLLAFQDLKDVVTVGNDGYMLLPPEIVCAPQVEEAHWAPYGRYILARRTDPRATPTQVQKAIEGTGPPPISRTTLVLWSAQSRESREIWSSATTKARVQTLGWFAGTDVGYLVVEFQDGVGGTAVYRIPGSTGRIEPVVSGSASGYFYPSPVRSIALFGRVRFGVSEATARGERPPFEVLWSVVRSNGEVGPTFRTEPNAFPTAWSVDGKRAYLRVLSREGRGRWLHLDLETTQSSEGGQPRDLVPQTPPQALLLSVGGMAVGGRTVRLLQLAAREGEANSVMVAGDVGRLGELSPSLDGVLYDSSQALFVRPLIKLDAAKLKQMAEAAERARLMSNAKQVALALMMYGADRNDEYPPPGNIGSLIEPYLKNMSIYEGFTYTFEGGDVKKPERPAETQIGYIVGPGGRAIAYLDGHVQWKPD